MARCLTGVRNALKSGPASNADRPTKCSARHRSIQLPTEYLSWAQGYAKAPSLLLLNSIQIIDNGEHAGSRDGIWIGGKIDIVIRLL